MSDTGEYRSCRARVVYEMSRDRLSVSSDRFRAGSGYDE